MDAEELAFYRQNAELDLSDTGLIQQLTKVDDDRGGESEIYVDYQTLPCRVTHPVVQLNEQSTGFSPHTEERWDISFSATTIETLGIRILQNWRIIVRGITYQVLDGGEEQTEAFLYHVAVERLN